MKKFYISLLLSLVLIFSGCVSESEKSTVREGFKQYFTYLAENNYASANLIAYDFDVNDGIISDITSCEVNDFIFKKISYEIWGISKEDNIIYVDTVINQLSLVSAYAYTAEEFYEYKKSCAAAGKEYSQSALDAKFDELFYNNIKSSEEYTVYRCSVPCVIENGSLRIGITDKFRNALFGGELDAIRSMESQN